jgi:pimeloyl-ACP methyl ester carboxylesterase
MERILFAPQIIQRIPRHRSWLPYALGVVAATACLSFADAAAGEPIPAGPGQQGVRLAGKRHTIFTYRPDCNASAVLLLFHGRGGVRHYRDAARDLADRTCMIVVAPRFRTRRATYQQGGIVIRGEIQDRAGWTVNIVAPLVDWARAETGVDHYFLVGHSAGAQFLSRVAAFQPNAARRIVIANPSTHVLPSLDVQAPFGLGGLYSGAEGEARLRRYLEQPLTIYLGENDTEATAADLDTSPNVMAQGKTRLERGMATFAAGKQLAASRNWSFNWRLVRVPGVGHNARKMLSAPEAAEALRP